MFQLREAGFGSTVFDPVFGGLCHWCIFGGAVRNMKKLVHFVLPVLFLLGSASAQNLPAIDVFGGYSYLSLNIPAETGTGTTAQRLAMNGWDLSASVGIFHRLAVEGDISGHSLGNCLTNTFNCTNLSYMGGARFNFRDRSSKLTGFVHVLGGRDNATLALPNNSSSQTDTSVALAGGGGVDYWLFRHIGVQLGPVDYFYTRHLNTFGVPSQNSFRASAGVVFRFGGDLFAGEPKAQPAPSESQPEPKSKRGAASQTSAGGVQQPAQLPVSIPGRGMPITSLGVVVAPQEFDGAKIVEIVSGGVAEMASLKAGDLIKSVDGKAVRTPMELAAELSDKSGKVRIGIQRGTFATETLVLLGNR